MSSVSDGPRTDEYVQVADSLARAGRADEAMRAWERVLAASPEHPRALFSLGQRAFQLGNPAKARDLLRRAAAVEPNEWGIFLNLAAACRALGDSVGELAALDSALKIDDHLPRALLMKAGLLERQGKTRSAASVYRHAISAAPSYGPPPPDVAVALEHAHEVVTVQSAALESYLTDQVAAVRQSNAEAAPARFDEALGIAAGTKKVFVHQPLQFHYPRLPAIGYHDEADFPWLKDLEAAAPAIRDELTGLISEEMREFSPYIHRADNVPVQQWGDLNHSTKWSAYFLWENGIRSDPHCTRCPVTSAVLDAMPMANMPGYAPTAFFSSLEPRARIPPHTGSTNARLIVHLPLIVPEGCFFRVANETREWKFGKPWIFDDSIEHEAWSDSDRQRVILIFDIWNPLLSQAERELVSALLTGLHDYYAQDGRPVP